MSATLLLYVRSGRTAARVSGLGKAMGYRTRPTLPSTLELAAAAQALLITPKKLSAMIDGGLVWTIRVADRELIPSSEVQRLARIRTEIARR